MDREEIRKTVELLRKIDVDWNFTRWLLPAR